MRKRGGDALGREATCTFPWPRALIHPSRCNGARHMDHALSKMVAILDFVPLL